jgi:predicted RNase H-like HicB family nuclease
MARKCYVVIERDSEGILVATVPALPFCHSQAWGMYELLERVKEAILLCLEVEGEELERLELVGIQRLRVAWVRATIRRERLSWSCAPRPGAAENPP